MLPTNRLDAHRALHGGLSACVANTVYEKKRRGLNRASFLATFARMKYLWRWFVPGRKKAALKRAAVCVIGSGESALCGRRHAFAEKQLVLRASKSRTGLVS